MFNATKARRADGGPQPGEPIGLLDVDAVAERLDVTSRFVCRLVHEHPLPFQKIGKFVRFDPHEIEARIDDAR